MGAAREKGSVRRIEVFSAGCPVCEEAVERIRQVACPSCEVVVLDMSDREVALRAAGMGIRTVPAAAIAGELAECCAERGPDLDVLRAAGLGQPV